MSYDGSSAKSYIRHTTEKERLDNLAFASFPEDYLPYAANSAHHRSAAPPPYLLWGDDRRRRPAKKRRSPKCAGALLCAIALVVFAILAVVAISVYLGVVTNLFRSPVMSVSGRFQASEDFSEELLNSSSSKFLEKVEIYQSKVEKAFLSSSLEPAFIAARIYSFRPGMVVFFRVYLDRRKIKQDGESPPTELVRELVTQKLASDPESVHVEENEELLSVELRSLETVHPPTPTTKPILKPTIERNGHQRPPASGGVGQWRPVPIEDSVSPSFAAQPAGNIGSVRSPEEIPKRNPAEGLGAVRVLDNTPARNPALPAINQGVGTVRVLEESPVRSTQLNNRDGAGSVRLIEETPPRKPQLIPQSGISSVSNSKEQVVRNPLFTTDRVEGVGSVRLLPESPLESPPFSIPPQGVGSVKPQTAPVLPGSAGEGVGSVRLIDESPKKVPQFPVDPRAGIGLVRVLEDTPPKKLPSHRNPPEGFVRSVEEPPTLAPSVSLVVRNRTRSDKPRNLLSRLEKGQQNSELKHQNIGIGSIREIAEESLPLPLQREPPAFASRLLDVDIENTSTMDSAEQNRTEDIAENTETPKTDSQNITTVKPLTTQLSDLNSKIENSKFDVGSPSQRVGDLITDAITSTPFEAEIREVTTKRSLPPVFISSLENILFSHPPSPFTTTTDVSTSGFTVTTESTVYNEGATETESENESFQNSDIFETGALLEEEERHENETISTTTENSNEDIHSSIVNYSQYLYPETHYHTVEKESNKSSEEPFQPHTLEGHGFHKPTNATDAIKSSTTESTTQMIPSEYPSTENQNYLNKTSEEVVSLSSSDSSTKESEKNAESSTQYPLESAEITKTTVAVNETLSIDDETGNVTTEDASQQGKVVPQLQSDLLSNDIGEEQSSEEDIQPFDDEILRHITTVRPSFNSSVTLVQTCPTGSVPCNESSQGCGVRCDMRKDCPNNEDETDCKCSDLLRAMGQSQKICDGVDDCNDRSDETNCSWCPSADYFRCPGSRACVTMDRVCDGNDDCPGAHDERRCVNLAEASSEAESYEYRSEGYLIVRRNGQWGKLCLDTLNRLQDYEIRIRELGRAVCSTLTYKNMSSSVRAQDKNISEDSYFQISTETASKSSGTSIFSPTPCKKKEVLRVQCTTLECGLRPSAKSSQRRRIVGGRSADGVGSWPWAAALYREGDFQCGAALISDIWLVSAGHCFYSSRHAYWNARLGVLRRGSELLSSEEQVRRIQNIILHPDYEDMGFINDIALLRMDRPVSFSDSLRPICLPSSPAEDASLWHGRRCTVVGWGKLYEIGHTFPDSLQEVRLPVISSAECQKRSIFLPAYRITPNMFCAGFDRGGRDACLGDSGGPMACQRPADGRWILLGVTSNGDGCGRPGRPGVYSQVAGFLTWIQETISSNKTTVGNTGSESTCSRGVRCRLGRCIPQTRVCDGRRDCAGGEDEEGC